VTPQTETRDPDQARREATAAIDQLAGDGNELYRHSKPLVEAFWPELSPLDVAWMARAASELGLDILKGEVIWYPDRPYVTIKGLLRLLNRDAQFDNYELEPAGDDLRRAMRVARDEEQVWVCRLWRKDRTRPSVGYGRATPEDTFAGYGRLEEGNAPDPDRPFRTPAVAEMAQERAVRHAAQGAFGWEFTSSLEEPAAEIHRRVDPANGGVAPLLEDGSPNTVGCTASQRRCIHALARALGLAEGRVVEETGKVLEEGWRSDLYRLYGKTSTMNLTATEAGEFIETLTSENPGLEEAGGAREAERVEMWRRIQELLEALPRDAARQVYVWFRNEQDLDITTEELKGPRPPKRAPLSVLRKVVEGLRDYQVKVEPGPGI